jgi:DNA-binding response OmpR family regulator
MKLQSLVFCADEKILRVLRRVLSDLEIAIDPCGESDTAIHKLTRQRYEAVIVDCADERAASQVLRSARTAPCNKRAVAVAILDANRATRSAFDLGAHFVLYKPISGERAKTSFRAARALMKRERRRNTRIPVEIPVNISGKNGAGSQRTVTSDLSEGGIAVQPAPSTNDAGPMNVVFTLPGTEFKVQCQGEVAWANSTRQAGIRFLDLSEEARNQLKDWLQSHAPELDKDDPPVPCKLTDLSPGGGYLETAAPFPARTRVILSVQVGEAKARVEGLVCVTHPEVGMGVEFVHTTPEHKRNLDQFIQILISGDGALPEILVQPEGLEAGEAGKPLAAAPSDDPLVGLFHSAAMLSAEAFMAELQKHRAPQPVPATA